MPYRFVEQEALKNFAQAFDELGASHSCVPASEFIVGHLTVRKNIVSKLPYIQATISSLQEPAELDAVSVVADLWSDNVVSCYYLDVTFWVEDFSPSKRKWSLKHAMYACKFFPENNSADHIQVALDQILFDAGLDADNTTCNTCRQRVKHGGCHKI